MSQYFAYTRVSTVKQGDGVSLEAQRDAIAAYAEKHGLSIAAWFEEKETAAKRGRPVFNRVISGLLRGDAAGLIVHKIDRSARNFSDWAKVGELLDGDIDVRFVHESLDLRSRGGRLTADIQAVIAADYVRNLREECLKGIEGRLKQGLFPFNAPIGYLNPGAGKPKTPDPERAPFVRQAFELYASQQYSIRGLLAELQARGFRNRGGKPITKGCLENLLSNPFYSGLILLKSTSRRYPGIHEPLISKALFDRVQSLKENRQHKKQTLHNHTYRRLITCGFCQRSLIGERQKGHVYMRCQTKGCATKTIRADRLEGAIGATLLGLQLTAEDHDRLKADFKARLEQSTEEADRHAIELQLSNLDARLDMLTDALIDGLIDKPTFQTRKQRLEDERAALKEALQQTRDSSRKGMIVEKFLELVKSVSLTYQMADPGKKRRIIEIAFSNRQLTGRNLSLKPHKWLQDASWTLGVLCGPPDQARTRTVQLVSELHEAIQSNDAA